MKKKTLGNLLLAACSILTCLVLLEVLLRIYDPFGFRLKGDTIILPAHKRYSITNTSCDKLEKTITHSKNSHGFRGPEIPPDFKDSLSLFAVGGSTTECLLLSDRHDWPFLVGEKLMPFFPRLWINNAGLDGHSTYGHYLLMENFIAGLSPKVVLFLIGINDTEPYSAYFHDQSLLRKNTAETIAACTAEIARSVVNRKFIIALNALHVLSVNLAEKSQLTTCLLNLYRTLKARQQGLQHTCINFSSLAYTTVPDDEYEKKMSVLKDKVVPGFRTRLLRLMDLTKHAGIYPVLITQPAIYGSGIDPDTGVDMDNVQCGEHNGMTQWEILEMLNGVTRDVAEKEKIALIDLAREMPRRSAYFYDFIHFTNSGSEVVAGIIAAQLRTYLENNFPGYSIPGSTTGPEAPTTLPE